MCLAQGPQRSDVGEARTQGPSVSSQALYHWANALPTDVNDVSYYLYVNDVTYHSDVNDVSYHSDVNDVSYH